MLKTIVTIFVWLGFDTFRPVHNHSSAWSSHERPTPLKSASTPIKVCLALFSVSINETTHMYVRRFQLLVSWHAKIHRCKRKRAVSFQFVHHLVDGVGTYPLIHGSTEASNDLADTRLDHAARREKELREMVRIPSVGKSPCSDFLLRSHSSPPADPVPCHPTQRLLRHDAKSATTS